MYDRSNFVLGCIHVRTQRTLRTGEVLSKESRKAFIEGLDDEKRLSEKPHRTLNFVLPILAVIAMTIITDDMIIALVIAILLCFIMYLAQGLMNVLEFVSSSPHFLSLWLIRLQSEPFCSLLPV